MATVEFLNKRIEGKEKEITKLEKKLERVLKAQATNWEVNPHYYDETTLKWTVRDLEDAKKSLEDYREQLIVAGQKANSRNVPVITEFLNRWFDQSVKFFTEQKVAYTEAKKVFYEEYYRLADMEYKVATREEREKLRTEKRALDKQFTQDWKHVTQFDNGAGTWEENMVKALKREYDRKYDFIIERTVAITGTITDATQLRIGSTGELNGFIIGETGKASVKTIGAGGYNIQCFHFRTLINRVK